MMSLNTYDPNGGGSGSGVPTSRTISTTAPLTGGGDLSANRTLSMPAATSGQDGYLTSMDWSTFNAKQAALAGLQSVPGMSAISGILKVSSGVPSAAAAGTDYYNPGGTDVAVADGGTGAGTAADARTNLVVPEGVTDSAKVSVGASTTYTGTRSTVVGATAYNLGYGGTAIGYNAWIDNFSGCVAVGHQSWAAAGSATALGYGASAQGESSIAIGQASVTGQGSFAFGFNASAAADNICVFGSGSEEISAIYAGKGYSHATPTTWGIYGTRGSGTNIAGGDLIVAGGAGTGTGAGGSILFQTAVAGASGSSVNSLATVLEIDETGIGAFGATPVGQASHITDADGTTGGNQTAINAILVVLENLGFVAAA